MVYVINQVKVPNICSILYAYLLAFSSFISSKSRYLIIKNKQFQNIMNHERYLPFILKLNRPNDQLR